MGAFGGAPDPMNAGLPDAAGLHEMIAKVIPAAPGAQQKLDGILGIAFRALDSAVITDAQFRELTTKCLDRLPHLGR